LTKDFFITSPIISLSILTFGKFINLLNVSMGKIKFLKKRSKITKKYGLGDTSL